MRFILAFLTTLTLASPALAGTKAVYLDRSTNSHLQLEIADNGDLRMSDPVSPRAFYVLQGDIFYWAIEMDGGWKVVRITDLAAALDKGMSPELKALFKANAAADKAKLAITALGEKRINGRVGIAYRIEGQLTQLDPDRLEFVMSKDPALAPIGRALQRLVTGVPLIVRAYLPGPSTIHLRPEASDVFKLGTPIGGDLLELKNVETHSLDPQRFTLPAKAMTVDEIVKWLG